MFNDYVNPLLRYCVSYNVDTLEYNINTCTRCHSWAKSDFKTKKRQSSVVFKVYHNLYYLKCLSVDFLNV